VVIGVSEPTISLITGGLKAEKVKKNTPLQNLLFFQKISDSAYY
jgi:hypothetical protein